VKTVEAHPAIRLLDVAVAFSMDRPLPPQPTAVIEIIARDWEAKAAKARRRAAEEIAEAERLEAKAGQIRLHPRSDAGDAA
jgi:hypothetical protein